MNPLGAEFAVNTYSPWPQVTPDIACSPSGFVVVWAGATAEQLYGVAARRFTVDGDALGIEFQVNTTTGDVSQSPDPPRVLGESDGSFTVVWLQYGSPSHVAYRRFSSDGSPIDPTQLELSTGHNVLDYAAEIDGSGSSFVVALRDSSNFHRDLQLRRYDSEWQEVAVVRLENQVLSFQERVLLATTFSGPSGEVLLARDDYWQQPRAWRFDADLTQSGPSFVVSREPLTYDWWILDRVDLVGQVDGEFVVAWTGLYFNDDYDLRPFIQRAIIVEVFSDGFETGDLSAWSSKLP